MWAGAGGSTLTITAITPPTFPPALQRPELALELRSSKTFGLLKLSSVALRNVVPDGAPAPDSKPDGFSSSLRSHPAARPVLQIHFTSRFVS
ncbi:MAG: hypothetical protein ACXQTG_07015 [Methanoculleaceae archaeon]